MTKVVKIAFSPPTGKFIHIDKASNGLSCMCECLKCNERLEAVQGEIRTKHFRHHKNVNCEGSQETALHELGKQILVDNSQIAIPAKGIIGYSEAVAEQRLESIRPDVSAIYDKKPIYFEIFVSHTVDSGKEKLFKAGKHRSLEIDLSNCTTFSFEKIKNLVLNNTNNKKIFYWEDEKVVDFVANNEPKNTKQVKLNWLQTKLNGLIELIPWIAGILIFFRITRSFRRSRRR